MGKSQTGLHLPNGEETASPPSARSPGPDQAVTTVLKAHSCTTRLELSSQMLYKTESLEQGVISHRVQQRTLPLISQLSHIPSEVTPSLP